MEIENLIIPEIIDLDLKSKNRHEAILDLIKILYEEGKITSVEEFYKDVLKREEVGSTGMGNYIAIPHGESEAVLETSIAIGRVAEPIEWESIDGTPAKLIFLIAVPKSKRVNEHIKILGGLAAKLIYKELVDILLVVKNKEEFIIEFLGSR